MRVMLFFDFLMYVILFWGALLTVPVLVMGVVELIKAIYFKEPVKDDLEDIEQGLEDSKSLKLISLVGVFVPFMAVLTGSAMYYSVALHFTMVSYVLSFLISFVANHLYGMDYDRLVRRMNDVELTKSLRAGELEPTEPVEQAQAVMPKESEDLRERMKSSYSPLNDPNPLMERLNEGIPPVPAVTPDPVSAVEDGEEVLEVEPTVESAEGETEDTVESTEKPAEGETEDKESTELDEIEVTIEPESEIENKPETDKPAEIKVVTEE